jgi:hypothetical protein
MTGDSDEKGDSSGVSVTDFDASEEGMSEDDLYQEFVDNHWALPLLGSPSALVSVIETKIARAELAERRRIINILENITPGSGPFGDDVTLAVQIIKGEK